MNLHKGKVLKIDLTKGEVVVDSLREDWIRQYWGGWGLAARYFVELHRPGTESLAPDNPLVIMTGPFCGTLVPLSSRFCLVSKSPHTGTIFETNAGGAFGPELKFAGFDGVIITGQAGSPVFLRILDGVVTLEDARPIWGKGIFESERFLKASVGSPEAKTMCIGPAGENLIPFSCIGSEAYRQMGRGGAGALFGSKNLKAIVCRGTGAVQVADMEAFLERISTHKQTNLLTNDNLWAHTDGTPLLVEVTNGLGIHPTQNFTYGVNEGREAINSDAVKGVKLGDRACASCPLACGKFTRMGGAEVEGPEYETLALTGSNCGINDLEQVIRFNRICDDLGLDTISTGATIALAMDMSERGINEFGLRFGEPAEYLKAASEIALLSTSRGRDLALGVRKLSEKYGASHLAAHSKGLEFPAYDPRGNYGMGLAYATSERGACHLRAFTIFTDKPFDHEQMAHEVFAGQNWNAIKWAMCLCDFWGSVNSSILADLLSAGLGESVDAAELDLAGERIWNLTRLFNLREGFTAAQDEMPERILRQSLRKGPHEGRVLSAEDLTKMKNIYFQLRGWDTNGVPGAEKLAHLGLHAL